MAYADRKDGSSRIVAIVIVALVHAVLGYALVTGLAYNVVKKVAEDLNTFDVKEEPPPPEEEPPPPPPDQPSEPPPVVAPPPIVQTNVQPPQTITTVSTPPVNFTPTLTAPPAPPPAPPAPPARNLSAVATARGDQGGWFTQDDYPPAAQRAGAEGRVSARVQVGANGRATSCEITSSSGNSDLDRVTCSLVQRRGRFNPAKDSSGNPIPSVFNLRNVRWVLEDN